MGPKRQSDPSNPSNDLIKPIATGSGKSCAICGKGCAQGALLFPFPADDCLRSLWDETLREANVRLGTACAVCGIHFEPSEIVRVRHQCFLSPTAVPSRNLTKIIHTPAKRGQPSKKTQVFPSILGKRKRGFRITGHLLCFLALYEHPGRTLSEMEDFLKVRFPTFNQMAGISKEIQWVLQCKSSKLLEIQTLPCEEGCEEVKVYRLSSMVTFNGATLHFFLVVMVNDKVMHLDPRHVQWLKSDRVGVALMNEMADKIKLKLTEDPVRRQRFDYLMLKYGHLALHKIRVISYIIEIFTSSGADTPLSADEIYDLASNKFMSFDSTNRICNLTKHKISLMLRLASEFVAIEDKTVEVGEIQRTKYIFRPSSDTPMVNSAEKGAFPSADYSSRGHFSQSVRSVYADTSWIKSVFDFLSPGSVFFLCLKLFGCLTLSRASLKEALGLLFERYRIMEDQLVNEMNIVLVCIEVERIKATGLYELRANSILNLEAELSSLADRPSSLRCVLICAGDSNELLTVLKLYVSMTLIRKASSDNLRMSSETADDGGKSSYDLLLSRAHKET